jgi:hypothetical protein
MVLISCDACAVMFDAEKLPFASDCRAINDEGLIREDLFTFKDHKWIAFTPCPTCGVQLLKPGELK